MWMKISIIQGNEKIIFWSRFTRTWTEYCAEKNCNGCERYRLRQGQLRKSAVRISKFFPKVMQDKSNIIFQAISHVDGYFNNSRK